MFENIDWKLGFRRSLWVAVIMTVIYIVFGLILGHQWARLQDEWDQL